MKTTRNILISTLTGLCMTASGYAADLGSATITVIHPLTLEPVPRVPVTVIRVVKPETKAPIHWTGRNGSVTLVGIPEGRYEAYVSYNNMVSESVRFEVIADYHPFVTLFFNPDINN